MSYGASAKGNSGIYERPQTGRGIDATKECLIGRILFDPLTPNLVEPRDPARWTRSHCKRDKKAEDDPRAHRERSVAGLNAASEANPGRSAQSQLRWCDVLMSLG